MVAGFTRFTQPTTRHPTSRRRIRVRVLRDRLGPQRRRFNIRSEVRRFKVRTKVPIRISSYHHRRRRDLWHREPHPATTSSPRTRSRTLRHLSAKSTTSTNLHPGLSPPPPTSGSPSRDSIRYNGLLYSTMNRDQYAFTPSCSSTPVRSLVVFCNTDYKPISLCNQSL